MCFVKLRYSALDSAVVASGKPQLILRYFTKYIAKCQVLVGDD